MNVQSGWFDFGIFGSLAGALGMAATGAEFAVGIFMALAGAIAASRILAAGMVSEAKPLGFVGTLSVGLFVGILSGQGAGYYVPDMPLTFAMGLGGFLSSFLAPMILKIMSILSGLAPVIARRLLNAWLPGKQGPNPPK